MNDKPMSSLEHKKDRRGLLALIGAGGAAALAALLSRSDDAQAHGFHQDSSDSDPAIHGNNNSTGPGVQGNSSTGIGVWGISPNMGVFGDSTTGIGVGGYTSTGTGVKGTGNPGVHGFGGDATGVQGDGKTGVLGVGKWAVLGKANAAGGAGVFGNAGTGSTGVYATATGTKAALNVRGRSRFKQSGKTTISAGAYSKVVPLTFTLAAGSIVVATLQGNAGSGVAVRTASKYGSNKIRITLIKAATKSATIAYFIFTP